MCRVLTAMQEMQKSPLTGSSDVRLLERFATRDIAERWRKCHGIDVSAEFHGQPECFLYCCNQTGLRFFGPPAIAGSSRLYAALQEKDWYWYDWPLRWEHRRALRSLQPGSRVLEVGCGLGTFVQAALRAGLDIRGIERSPRAVQVAKSRGLPVEVATLESIAEAAPASFDAICAFQVLEHVTDPLQFAALCKHALRPGGLLIIGVPNADGYLRHFDGVMDMPPHHMLRWNSSSLRGLGGLADLALVTLCEEPLAGYSVREFVDLHCKAWEQRGLPALFTCRRSRSFYRLLLHCGMRKLLSGHTIVATFCKN